MRWLNPANLEYMNSLWESGKRWSRILKYLLTARFRNFRYGKWGNTLECGCSTSQSHDRIIASRHKSIKRHANLRPATSGLSSTPIGILNHIVLLQWRQVAYSTLGYSLSVDHQAVGFLTVSRSLDWGIWRNGMVTRPSTVLTHVDVALEELHVQNLSSVQWCPIYIYI